MAVPFLFELRTLMDWIWTDTSMTLMDWLKMEDIFASVFLLKVFSCNINLMFFDGKVLKLRISSLKNIYIRISNLPELSLFFCLVTLQLFQHKIMLIYGKNVYN